MRVPIRITVTVDLAAYRAEYGDPDETATDAAEHVRGMAAGAVAATLERFDYVTRISGEADR